MSKTLIDKVTAVTSGSAVIVGSAARYYNGVTGSYRDIDIWIPSSSLQAIEDNFNLVSSSNGWTGILDDCKLIRQPLTDTDKKYHDVFISTNEPSSSVISGSKFCTGDYDLHIHRLASSSIGGTYLENKVQDLETLYGV